MTNLLRRLRYLGYAAAALLWLIVMLTPCFAVALAARGELSWQRSEHASDRIWLIQEGDQRGIGLASERVISDNRASGGAVCVRTQVRFFLWRGSAQNENTQYCECYTPDGSSANTCS